MPKVDNQFIKQAQKDGGMNTQLTQVVTQATQNHDFQEDVIEIDSADEGQEIHAHPIFEIFWQVRPPHPCPLKKKILAHDRALLQCAVLFLVTPR